MTATRSFPHALKVLRCSLFSQIAIALVLGVLVGSLWPGSGSALQVLSEGFIQLVETVISPLVFCVVVTGIASAGSLGSFGRIGLKALLWFEVASTLALGIGLLAANLVGPGNGLHADASKLDTSALTAQTGAGHLDSVSGFILASVPDSWVGAFANNSVLPVLIIGCLVGAALLHIGQEKAPGILPAIRQVQELVFTVVGYVMRLSPLAVFGSTAHLVGKYGMKVITSYGSLIAVCYGAAVLFLVLLAVALRVATGISLWRFVRYIRAEMLLALGTASTESVMPAVMRKLRAAGCRDDAVGLVFPTGYSFNLDGASIYLSIGLLFIAQGVGIHLTLGQQLTALFVLMLTSKGMAGVPGSAFLAVSSAVTALGTVPAAAVVLLLGADRIMDSMRVVVNLLGNCAAVFAVSRWEGALDLERAKAALAGAPVEAEPESEAEGEGRPELEPAAA
ncbi:MAG TPA: cation:dicarboxylase symporter family transporter [Actinospica sp.]|nr:cation:dicarboxylase symporter family transporter [Actinospica sp.]